MARTDYGQKYAAMTFDEIARQLGVSGPAVRMVYLRGMRKIRHDREALEKFRWLVEERQRARTETVYPEWT